MDLRDRPEDVAFRQEVRDFLQEHLVGEFAELGGRGGSGDETFGFEVRRRWEKVLAGGGWTCLGWPVEHGGRGATMTEQVIFNEEYARAAAPGRVNVMGEGLLGPTLIHYGTPEQKARFLPPIREGTELWCQGYSEPDAGSDLANVKTRAERDGDQWVVTGQKVWTSLAHLADWCFVVCRTDPGLGAPQGAVLSAWSPWTSRASRCGPSPSSPAPASSTRCSSTAPAPMSTTWSAASARAGASRWPRWPSSAAWRCSATSSASGASSTGWWRWPRRTAGRATRWCASSLAQAHIELTIMRYNTLRSLAGVDGPVAPPEASIAKLYWGSWHRRLGELAMQILGPAATVLDGEPLPENGGYGLGELQRSFLFARSETIYGGSNQIQRNIIGERVLGLPPEPKGVA